MTRSTTGVRRVLVVDASAVVRQDVSALLRDTGHCDVVVAANVAAARQRLRRAWPDVVLLGLEPPGDEALSLLREMVAASVPVVVGTRAASRKDTLVQEALCAGARDVLHWPRVGIRAWLEQQAEPLAALLLGATRRTPRAPPPPCAEKPRPPPPAPKSSRVWARQVVAVGASTGGPAALRSLMGALPANAPALLVVQHMSEPFAAAFAQGLAEACKMEVRRAMNGDRVRPGLALLAPGDQHLRLVLRPDGYAVELSSAPPVRHHRPSVDVLFHSVAEVAGPDAVGVLLTGMGDDGADGLAAMRRTGAATLAQDAATSVVYGMPRAAMLRGAAEQSLPLDSLPEAILNAASHRGPPPSDEEE
ncbi:chemotaxis-specific protein-glutamate methyltransferase CheB [Pyxidicoccus parkwayensis]|uniref:Protein-glutamate methylesterase/protein-glutamine glutaminase n=1 Tax=Pyxidicoccus parkwayensis TaxID=2813578 RepID=A0ABX7NMC8_9BACT|nr:chemotaxis-specific protein-glutamate methyltransferase CheB [Pyxidicoccus parkwaysis]QSQ20007.1 chemotaxis-specific protein-glutamate methyltransferase CheB [Pyxidicoccus parkwaysis]